MPAKSLLSKTEDDTKRQLCGSWAADCSVPFGVQEPFVRALGIKETVSYPHVECRLFWGNR